jgi:hypothetical protein
MEEVDIIIKRKNRINSVKKPEIEPTKEFLPSISTIK